jgi:hypothetical protein
MIRCYIFSLCTTDKDYIMHIVTKSALFIVVSLHASSHAASFPDQYKNQLITAINDDIKARTEERGITLPLSPLAATLKYTAHSASTLSWPIMKLSTVCAAVGGVLQLTRLQEAVTLWKISAASTLLLGGITVASLGLEYLPQYWHIDELGGVGASIAAITLAAALIRIGCTQLDKAMDDRQEEPRNIPPTTISTIINNTNN